MANEQYFSNIKKRQLIVHFDDLGMFESTVTAYEKMLDSGKFYSVSIMPSAPYFNQAVSLLKKFINKDALDVGVHLTLNSEWSNLKWGPVSELNKVKTLIDSNGFLHENSDGLLKYSKKQDIQTELKAQIEKVINAHIEITHIDSHMLALLNKKYAKLYAQLADQYGVGIMLPCSHYNKHNLRPDLSPGTNWLEKRGRRLIDNFEFLSYEKPRNRIEQFKKLLSNLPEGVTHIGFHPAENSEELQGIAPDWRIRVADFELLMSDKLDNILSTEGIELTNYAALSQENSIIDIEEKNLLHRVKNSFLRRI